MARTRLRSAALLCAVAAWVIFAGGAGSAAAAAGSQDAAQRLYEHAESLIDDGDPAGAFDEYMLLVQQFPGSDLVDDALLRIAQLHAARGEIAEASETATRIADEYPRTSSAAGARVLMAEQGRAAARTTPDLEAVREDIGRVPILYARSDFPDLVWRTAAKVLAGEISLELGDARAASGWFVDAISESGTGGLRSRAQVGLARALIALGSWQEAAPILQEATARAGGGRYAVEATQLLGLLHRLVLRPAAGGRPWESARAVRSASAALERPIGVAARRDGSLFIGDEGVPFVALLDPAGTVTWNQRPMSPRGHPWFNRQGTAFFPTEGSVIEPRGRQRVTFTERRNNKVEPVEKLVAGDHGLFGEWIIAHDNGDRVSVFDREGGFVRSQAPSGRFEIVDLTVDRRGRVFLLDRRNKRVLRFSADGALEGTAAANGTWSRPQALAVDDLGNVYVLDRDDKIVEIFDAASNRIARIGPSTPGGPALQDPRDLAVDGAGRLFVADRRLAALVVLE